MGTIQIHSYSVLSVGLSEWMKDEELLILNDCQLLRILDVLKTNGPSFIGDIRHASLEFIKSNLVMTAILV